jgi:simple sugar transport system permease protein
MNTLRRVGLALLAPALAIGFSLVVTSLVLLLTGVNPFSTYEAMLDYASEPRTQTLIVNQAITYYLAAVAVAIGFRMNLFNIGVDGQYRLAAMLSAALGGAIALPAPLHVGVIILTAMLIGAMWAGIAGILKTTRGVSEVISTIMLNFIATGVVAFLLTEDKLGEPISGSSNIGTKPIPESGWIPGIALIPDSPLEVNGMIVGAAIVGVGFWFLIDRTRFGFDLRTTGLSETAAVASGVNVKRMVVTTMLISGAVAGLVGMPQLLGASHTYSQDFPAGLGFTGIAVALLGRNHPIGIALGALLFAFLSSSSQILDLEDVPKEIVEITQGVTVLSVVVAYEVVRRSRLRAEQREVARQLESRGPARETEGVGA